MTHGTDLRGPPSFILQGEVLMRAVSLFHPAEQTGWDCFLLCVLSRRAVSRDEQELFSFSFSPAHQPSVVFDILLPSVLGGVVFISKLTAML